MTLCIAWIEDDRRRIVAISDRRASAGEMKVDTVPKIHRFPCANVLMMWEGNVEHAKGVIESIEQLFHMEPRLDRRIMPAEQILERVLGRVNDRWEGVSGPDIALPGQHGLSFVVGAFDYARLQPVLRRIVRHSDNAPWVFENSSTHIGHAYSSLHAVGDGAKFVADMLEARGFLDSRTLADALRAAIADRLASTVGGIPQIVTLDRSGLVEYGVRQDGKEYVAGFESHAADRDLTLRFVDYDDLVPT